MRLIVLEQVLGAGRRVAAHAARERVRNPTEEAFVRLPLEQRFQADDRALALIAVGVRAHVVRRA